jgi:hypothetical protein
VRRHFQPSRASFIPKGSIKIVPKDIPVEIYLYESGGRPCALVFGGRRNKPDLHVQYRSSARREQALREHVENQRKVAEYKAEQAAKRSGFRHSFKAGDVLHYSWGYEQTNCEFYQVVSTTPGNVTMREIAQTDVPGSQISHGMAENRVARPGVFLDKSEPITKRPQFSESGPGYIPMPHGCCSLWDGRPKYCSWYA